MKVSNMRDKLYDTPPLVVNPELAAVLGLNEAIVFQQLHYWLKTSKHEHDGRKWIYNTLGEWQTQFPFWSEDVLQRTMRSLVRKEVVLVHKFNEQNWDRTNWYSIDYEKFEDLLPELRRITEAREVKRIDIATRRRRRKSASS